MKNLKFILIVISISFHLISFSQSDFHPGYYITLEQDTIFGLVDYRGDIRNSKQCVFKKNKSSEEIKFLPGEIHSYRFNEGKYYVSRIIEIEEEYQNLDTRTNEIRKISTDVFLEFLVNGIADVYYYRDSNGSHYFIEKEDGKFYELVEHEIRKYVEGVGNVIVKTTKHIGILKATFADYPELQDVIDKSSLNHQDLINIASEYHNFMCEGEECIIYVKQLPPIQFSFAPQVNFRYSRLKFINGGSLDDFELRDNLYPSIGLLTKITLPRINEKLAFELGVNFSKDYYYGYKETISAFNEKYEDLHVHMSCITGNLGVLYTYPKGKIRPVFGVGGSISRLIWNDLRIEREIVSDGEIYFETDDNLSERIGVGNVMTPFVKSCYGFYIKGGADFQIKERFVSIKLFYNLNYGTEVLFTNAVIKSGGLNISTFF